MFHAISKHGEERLKSGTVEILCPFLTFLMNTYSHLVQILVWHALNIEFMHIDEP